MPIAIGTSEWSQRSSRPDVEPVYFNDPRVAEAVKQKLSEPHRWFDRTLAQAFRRALREQGQLSPEQRAEAYKCVERLLSYDHPRLRFSGTCPYLALKNADFDQLDMTFELLREIELKEIRRQEHQARIKGN